MAIPPTTSPSLSIGTLSIVRTPPRSAAATRMGSRSRYAGSAVRSAMCTACLVRTARPSPVPGPGLLAIYRNRSNEFVLLEHGHAEHGTSAGHFNECHHMLLTFEVGVLDRDVGYVLQLSGCGNAGKGSLRPEADHRVAPPQLIPPQRGAV